MGFSKEQLLSRLEELQIDYSKYEHPVVLTVEAQAKYVGNLGGGLSKNLFLKDKKNRFYVVSALADTKVDLKDLSTRLGLGKGGVRMAPEEALGELLQVPLGCVTPFALVNESARNVALLLDQRFQVQELCLFHPLANDTTISLKATGLEKFLKSIGRDVSYVDLQAKPLVGKDQPPDLAFLVPSEDANPKQGLCENNASTDVKSAKIAAKVLTPSSAPPNSVAKTVTSSSGSATNVERFVEEIMEKTSSLLLAQITEETIKQHGDQLGTVLSNSIKSRLAAELSSTTMMFKNAAYTEGFQAGIHHHPKSTY